MAWIESHEELKDHPKVVVLSDLMGWNMRETIGALHVFWYWCLKYAPSGDLRKFNDSQLAHAVALNGADAKRWVDALVQSCWIDRGPDMLRVHDWPDYAGRYLRDSLFARKPEKWSEVLNLYEVTPSANSPPTVRRQSAVPVPYQTSTTTTAPAREVEFPNGFPESEEMAVAMAGMAGVPEQKLKQYWLDAAGRGGRDFKGQPVTKWAAHAKGRWLYEQNQAIQGLATQMANTARRYKSGAPTTEKDVELEALRKHPGNPNMPTRPTVEQVQDYKAKVKAFREKYGK